MSQPLDLDVLEATALRRTRRGAVAQRDGQWLYRGRPMSDGVLLELYEVLAEDRLLEVDPADEYGLRRSTSATTESAATCSWYGRSRPRCRCHHPNTPPTSPALTAARVVRRGLRMRSGDPA